MQARYDQGIIDWDAKERNEPFIDVHGKNLFYSVENILLNPLYLIVLFAELQYTEALRALNIGEAYKQYDIGLESTDRLQEMFDWVITEVRTTQKTVLAATRSIPFYNGKSVELPVWYLDHQGHDLPEHHIKKAFKCFGSYQDEGKLQHELAIIAAKCYPLIPLTTVNMLRSIANE